LLDINDLPGIGQIELLPDGGLRVGALARMSDVAANDDAALRGIQILQASNYCCTV
jgi:xanthine dehydrogenase YagS FAD-binding subunit